MTGGLLCSEGSDEWPNAIKGFYLIPMSLRNPLSTNWGTRGTSK